MASFGGFSKLATMLCFCLVALSAYLISSTVAVTIEVDKDTNKLVLLNGDRNEFTDKLFVFGRIVDRLVGFHNDFKKYDHLASYEGPDEGHIQDKETYIGLGKQSEKIMHDVKMYIDMFNLLRLYEEAEDQMKDAYAQEDKAEAQLFIRNIAKDFTDKGFVIDVSEVDRIMGDINEFLREGFFFVNRISKTVGLNPDVTTKLSNDGGIDIGMATGIEEKGEEVRDAQIQGIEVVEMAIEAARMDFEDEVEEQGVPLAQQQEAVEGGEDNQRAGQGEINAKPEDVDGAITNRDAAFVGLENVEENMVDDVNLKIKEHTGVFEKHQDAVELLKVANVDKREVDPKTNDVAHRTVNSQEVPDAHRKIEGNGISVVGAKGEQVDTVKTQPGDVAAVAKQALVVDQIVLGTKTKEVNTSTRNHPEATHHVLETANVRKESELDPIMEKVNVVGTQSSKAVEAARRNVESTRIVLDESRDEHDEIRRMDAYTGGGTEEGSGPNTDGVSFTAANLDANAGDEKANEHLELDVLRNYKEHLRRLQNLNKIKEMIMSTISKLPFDAGVKSAKKSLTTIQKKRIGELKDSIQEDQAKFSVHKTIYDLLDRYNIRINELANLSEGPDKEICLADIEQLKQTFKNIKYSHHMEELSEFYELYTKLFYECQKLALEMSDPQMNDQHPENGNKTPEPTRSKTNLTTESEPHTAQRNIATDSEIITTRGTKVNKQGSTSNSHYEVGTRSKHDDLKDTTVLKTEGDVKPSDRNIRPTQEGKQTSGYSAVSLVVIKTITIVQMLWFYFS
ncbi:hypothetical protein BaOVIS_005300 [Babesia ovis]|uniref:Uncharacterized protein n=1 Tax=Babesia ovis TaxID=5869 RepID=A0A9W5WTR9_BABOV|nr:hypothetical protein BaOVIS_005300 [Babesia ovis]